MHEGYDLAEVLTVSENSMNDEWILDLWCSYHMTPFRHYFQELEELEEVKFLWVMTKNVVKG